MAMAKLNPIPDMGDVPFGCPPDTILDLPVPPSVNKTRRVNWAAMSVVADWIKRADVLLTASGQYRMAKKQKINGPYELTIILNEAMCKLDPDNPIKTPIDYLRRLELIPNDSPKFARRIVIEWGDAPEGCRLVLRPVEVKS
jgi:hypothetical protein